MKTISSQDWYRVRRGEDDLAWGARWRVSGASVIVSDRACQEIRFLSAEQQERLREELIRLGNDPVLHPRSEPLIHAGPRWLLELDDFRVVFSFDWESVCVSTVRGGRVLDPEMVHVSKWPPVPSWLTHA
jgi:mRNA-degrading endonuclease RelE of RelBE toxin-antitoxin system